MIKVEVKYYGKPIKLNKERTEIIKYTNNYTINGYTTAKDYYDSPQAIMRKEITQIFKRFKGLYFVKFYIDELKSDD